MSSIYPCPQCGEYHYHRSHSRNLYEKLRKRLLKDRVFRCHKCGYRGWIRIKDLESPADHKVVYLYLFAVFAALLIGMVLKSILR